MDSHKVDSPLDLRTINMASDIPLHPSRLPSFNLCSPQSPLYDPSSVLDSMPLASSSLISPTLSMTQRVLKAAFTRTGKPIRPFKVYPKNPLCLTMKEEATKYLYSSSSQAYIEFRQRMLLQMSSSLKMRRSSSPGEASVTSASGGEQEEARDPTYWERRRKNNEAAKRSRDARRAKEDEIAIRAAFLEQENIKLKYRVVSLRNELGRLRCILYSQN